jgi:hypothetical protein
MDLLATPLRYTLSLPPVDLRYALVCDSEGKLCLQAIPMPILQRVIMRWSIEVIFEEAVAHLWLKTQRQWSDQIIARTTSVPLALFSFVTVLGVWLTQGGRIPVSGRLGLTKWS